MESLYLFLSGTGLWIAFLVFAGGLLIRIAYLFGISRDRDAVLYNHIDWSWSWRSIVHWLLPLGSRSFRENPLMGVAFFLFHVGIVVVPIFLLAHNMLFEEAFGWSLPTLPDSVADVGTVVVLICLAFFLVRRLALAQVRIVTSAWDYVLLFLVAAPFATGFLAYHQIGDYDLMMVLHVLAGDLMLIVIPFSKLGHLILFFFTRAFIGSEMGNRREVDGRLGARTW